MTSSTITTTLAPTPPALPTRINLQMIDVSNADPSERVIFDGQKLELMHYNDPVANHVVSGSFNSATGVLTLTMQDSSFVEIDGFINATNLGIGIPGPRGQNGRNGLNGRDGKDGPPGPIGKVGPPGNTGSTGPQGAHGTKGTTGSIGGQGPQGYQGPQGSQGPQGHQGPPGPIGNKGIPGPIGPPGVDGTTLDNVICDGGVLYFYLGDKTVHTVPLCNKSLDQLGNLTTVAPTTTATTTASTSSTTTVPLTTHSNIAIITGVKYNDTTLATEGVGAATPVPIPIGYNYANTNWLISLMLAGDASNVYGLAYIHAFTDHNTGVIDSSWTLRSNHSGGFGLSSYISVGFGDATMGGISGNVLSGAAIPTPSGFSQSECTYIYSIGDSSALAANVSGSNSQSQAFLALNQTIAGNVVTNNITYEATVGSGGNSVTSHVGSVNYLVIAKPLNDSIGIAQGVIAHGSVIPTPVGTFTSYHIFVWPATIATNSTAGLNYFQCNVDVNGKVEVWCVDSNNIGTKVHGTANYVVVGIP